MSLLPRLFDVYIAVDWSARSLPSPVRPVRDAIWVGETVVSSTENTCKSVETYWTTRAACRAYLHKRLEEHVHHKRRVFLGFDFAYGYPAGFACALGLTDTVFPWRAVWNELSELISDDEKNGNNRFAVAAELNARCGQANPGPFWGCPSACESATLQRHSPVQGYPYPVRPQLRLNRLRMAEQRVGGIQPVWKLLGVGSVGSQTLLGIPTVSMLRDEPAFSAISRVWPYETGFTAFPSPEQGPWILHAEIWPALVPEPLDPAFPIHDQAQVRALVLWLRQFDDAGQLGCLFDLPANLSPEAEKVCVEEEGWILGVG